MITTSPVEHCSSLQRCKGTPCPAAYTNGSDHNWPEWLLKSAISRSTAFTHTLIFFYHCKLHTLFNTDVGKRARIRHSSNAFGPLVHFHTPKLPNSFLLTDFKSNAEEHATMLFTAVVNSPADAFHQLGWGLALNRTTKIHYAQH